MSRRRVSVKELGVADCQGWLHRRKEGRGFLGSKWKRYWFVLKRSSLYWYTGQMAEKAEGFISLADFTIEHTKETRKKHVMKASHLQVVTLFIAAESFTEMNKWISKLSAAAQTEAPQAPPLDSGECYSEASDQDTEECVSTSCPLNSEQETSDSGNAEIPEPCWASSPVCIHVPVSVPSSTSNSRPSSRTSSRSPSESSEPASWLDPPTLEGAWGGAHLPLEENPPDEMERLYVHLKRASLSPIGQPKPSNQRDFRMSFIRRCQNDKINEKLHLVRILNSTLKAKEADLGAVQQILADSTLTAGRYREWKLSNFILLQEIKQVKEAAGGARGLLVPPPTELCVAETSLGAKESSRGGSGQV